MPTALSIRQPWAFLIVHGYKPVENRRWMSQFRGPFLIHAGLRLDREGLDWLEAEGMIPATMPEPSELPKGGIVGGAVLWSVSAPYRGVTSPWRNPQQYAFNLRDPYALGEIVRCRGRLRFFNAPVESELGLCGACDQERCDCAPTFRNANV